MTNRTLDDFAERKLQAIDRRNLTRTLTVTDRVGGMAVERGALRLVSFACNDYLGLANDPETAAASLDATRRLGVGAGASRLITGSHSLYAPLELRLAELKGTDDAVVFGSGYLANLGIIPLLVGQSDLIVADELAHSCQLAGAELSNATMRTFRHNDADDAAAVVGRHRSEYRHCLLVTEGVFSMDGDLAPLPDLAALADANDCWLMTDDAHALGVVGGGRGSGFAHDPPVSAPLQMGTLSKAVGAYGGYLCASRPVTELVRIRARSFVFSTGLPPGTVAAATRALEIIANDADRVARPLALAREFTAALELAPAQSAIVPLIVGSNEAALAASAALERAGFLVAAIRPPTVPASTARLRFTFSAAHSDDDVAGLIDAVRELDL